MCTIRNFPNKIEHCVEWGLELFNKIITQVVIDYNDFIENPIACINKIKSLDNQVIMLDRLKSLYYLLEFKQDESNPEKLILLGKNIFKDNFITNIFEILETYPYDLINISKGQPFWSGKKIKPKLLKINDIGINYYYSLLKILGNTNSGIFDTSYIERLSNCIGNKFNLESKFIRKLNIDEEKDKVNIEVSEEEIDYYEGLINNFINQQDIYKKIENICKYDKDLQEHNELMTILVNLRAKCYSITETDNLSVKLISGKVVPAIRICNSSFCYNRYT